MTVSRTYGAGGLAVCRALAERLGYRLLDEELPQTVAVRLGTTPEIVKSVADRPRGLGERVLASLAGAVPETGQPAAPSEADLTVASRRVVEDAVRDAAAAGDVVIVGRMASAILGGRPDVVRVFLSAPLEWRVAHVAESLGIAADAARTEIARIDDARRSYAKEQYRVPWGDPRHYDLVLDTSRFGTDGSADVLAAAVRAASA
ncbi:MAG: cytidylate kinase-like family protein [Candidatus Eremiobacteraeota bacterium]|nr:cytidylate kinase-like family protein [Candidatus Eremiobacteraeota bacterium]